jgi:hypothetical protein
VELSHKTALIVCTIPTIIENLDKCKADNLRSNQAFDFPQPNGYNHWQTRS